MAVGAARRLQLGALACFLGILAGCSGPAKNPSCSSASQCAAGLECKANECVAPNQCASTQTSCANNSSCAAGSSCQSGCCTPLAAGACRSSSDCTDAAKPHCSATDSTCHGCAANAECEASLICTPTGACLQGCAKDSNCPAGQHCFAGTNGSWCGQCQGNNDCTDPLKPFCGGGVCTGCSSNHDCSGSTPACDTSTHKCVACLESQNAAGVNSECTDSAKPACVAGACQACAPSSDGTDGKNAACGSDTPFCNPTSDICVGCIDNTQCKSGDYCGSDKLCHTPVLTSECINTGTPCLTATTLVVGTTFTVAAKLDVSAVVDTTVTFDFTSGAASFASGSGLFTTTAVIPAGGTSTPPVNVFLDAVNANDVIVRATIGTQHQTVTVHIQTTPAALSNFTSDKSDVQEGQTATLTVTFDATPAGTATVTLTNDDPSIATIPASVDVSGSNTGTVTFNATALASGTAHLHAAYSGVTKNLSVNVFKVQVTNLTAANAQVGVGATDQLTVTVDSAPPAGASAIVGVNGTGGGGTVPATVTIPAGQTTANFNFTAGGSAGSESITAAAGGATSSPVTITVAVLTPKVWVVRIGDGSAALASTASNPVFIEEYDPVGGASQTPSHTINLPTTASGSNAAFSMVGGSTSEGGLSRSENSKYVTLAGYPVAPTASAMPGTGNRTVARIDASRNIDTTTQLTAFSGSNVRAATSSDGLNFWVSGTSSPAGTGGVWYVALGSSGTGTQVVSAQNNMRHVHVISGQLYGSTASTSTFGVAAVGSGEPTTTGTTLTLLMGSTTSGPVPYSFAMFDTDSTAGVDTAYVSQDAIPGTANQVNVQKWTLSGGVWSQVTFAPTFTDGSAAVGTRGLAAFRSGGTTYIVTTTNEAITSGTRILAIADDGVHTTPAPTVIATSPANSQYRGVALVPTP